MISLPVNNDVRIVFYLSYIADLSLLMKMNILKSYFLHKCLIEIAIFEKLFDVLLFLDPFKKNMYGINI